METKINSKALETKTLRLGLSACGIALAGPVDPVHWDFLKGWLGSGRHAEMAYMGNHFGKRCDPALLVESTHCVVSIALNYYPTTQLPEGKYQFTWYAYGVGYHDLMRKKLTILFRFIQESDVPELDGRVFYDAAPVPGRCQVQHAGLGWVGKNTQLIIPYARSAFFLGELFLSTEADTYNRPRPNRCGTCNHCLQTCSTQALEAPYGLDARRRLSYLTIEDKGEISASISPLMRNRVYGCDERQKACPWNRFTTSYRAPELQPPPEFTNMKKEDWQ